MVLSTICTHFGLVRAGAVDMVGVTTVGANMAVEAMLGHGGAVASVLSQAWVVGSLSRLSSNVCLHLRPRVCTMDIQILDMQVPKLSDISE